MADKHGSDLTWALLPLLLHAPGDLAFLCVQRRARGSGPERFANIPFAARTDGFTVDIGGERRRVLGFGEMLDRAQALAANGCDTYVTIARYDAPFYISDYRTVLGARVTDNVRSIAALFVDIDIGRKSDGTPHRYQAHAEAISALDEALAQTGLPAPSLVLNSGSGGAHVVWVLDRAVPPDEWLDMARRCVAALKAASLDADWANTTQRIAAPRLPGTVNWKTGEPRPVTITRIGGQLGDLGALRRNTDLIASAVAGFSPDMPGGGAIGRGNGDRGARAGWRTNFISGLTEPVTPQDVAALLAVLPNDLNYNGWVKLAFACWAVVRQSDATDAEQIVREAFVAWSLRYPHCSPGERKWIDPEKVWWSTCRPRDIGDAIFVELAREVDFWLPSRATAPAHAKAPSPSVANGISATMQSSAPGAALLKRVWLHFRLARVRGPLEAQRTVYRLLLAEPRENVLPVLGRIAKFLLTEDAEPAALAAFVDRLAGGGGYQFVAAVEARIAFAKARSAERLQSLASRAAGLPPIFASPMPPASGAADNPHTFTDKQEPANGQRCDA